MILGIMGMIDQIIDFNKSFVTQEVYEKHLYIFIFIALFLCSCGNHKADVATFSDVQFCGDFAAIFEPKSWSQANKFDLVFLKLKNRKPLYLLGISDFSWLGARTDSNRRIYI